MNYGMISRAELIIENSTMAMHKFGNPMPCELPTLCNLASISNMRTHNSGSGQEAPIAEQIRPRITSQLAQENLFGLSGGKRKERG
jgi:hypothetical protein